MLTAVLAANAFRDEPSLPLIFVVAGLLAATSSLQRPSREALEPRTVRHDQITAANALSSFGMQVGVLVGPAIGGVLIACGRDRLVLRGRRRRPGVASLLYAAMRPYPHRGRDRRRPACAGSREGWRYAIGRRDLLGTYLVDIAAMLLAMPVVLFPALAERGLRATRSCSGCSTPPRPSARCSPPRSAAGPRTSTTTAGPSCSRPRRTARASPWPASRRRSGWRWCFFALAGAADMVSAVFRGTVWNQTIPEHMRGRLAGIEMLSYSVGPLGGQVRAGFVADAWSVRGSIVCGGVACVGGVAVTAALAARLLVLRRAAPTSTPSPSGSAGRPPGRPPVRRDGGPGRPRGPWTPHLYLTHHHFTRCDLRYLVPQVRIRSRARWQLRYDVPQVLPGRETPAEPRAGAGWSSSAVSPTMAAAAPAAVVRARGAP